MEGETLMANRKDDKVHCYITVRSPGKVCPRCGADMSTRAANAEHCFKCAKELAREHMIAEKAYCNQLKKRDAVKPPKYVCTSSMCYKVCEACGNTKVGDNDRFCSKCGQRLVEVK